jgi:signal transduction histidine kinase
VQLQQVISNLVRNAIDAVAGVKDRLSLIEISTEVDADGAVKLAVRDNGIGLDPEASSRIFEAFYTTKSEGMGMGLAICRSIVEQHGGRLWAEKNEPHGATLVFTLPIEMKAAS